MAGLTEHPNLKTSFADNSPFTEELLTKGLNNPNTAINNIATELGNDAKGAALEAPASSATAVVNLLGQLKQAFKNIKGTADWHTGAAATLASIWAKFNDSTGHAHTGGANDAPKITAGGLATDAVETTKIKDLAVITAKIAALAITTARIAADAVDDTKMKLRSDNALRSRNAADNADLDVVKLGADNQLRLMQLSRQNIAANTVLENVSLKHGWTFDTPGAASGSTVSVTFDEAFSSVPVVIPGNLGLDAAADPTNIEDFTSFKTKLTTHAFNITTTGFDMRFAMADGSNFDANDRVGASWLAIGVKA